MLVDIKCFHLISSAIRYLNIMITSCLPAAEDSSVVLVACLSLGVAMVLLRPSEEIPVDSSVQPCTPTMQSSMMERSGGFSSVAKPDSTPDICIFTRVPGE